nr:zinc knuckle CX2CX4HX4C [Tanacetum cinerariifolium]
MNSHIGRMNWRELFPSITDSEHWHQSLKPGKHRNTLLQMEFMRRKIKRGKEEFAPCFLFVDWLRRISEVRIRESTNDKVNALRANLEESGTTCDESPKSVDINTKSKSHAGAAGASAKDQPKVNYNFRLLVAGPVFDGVNIFIPCKFVEKAKHRLKRIMMNNKGFFFFKFDSRTGLEAVLEGGPWLIRNSLIILKKWSMDTRLLKEELTRIPIWVLLHDVPIQVFEEDGVVLLDA